LSSTFLIPKIRPIRFPDAAGDPIILAISSLEDIMSQTISTLRIAPARVSLADRLSSAWRWIAVALDAATTRQHLAELSDHELADIGISRAQAQFEAQRPAWDLTVVRRR
jgi:uncharacterized protein YjiS (DUF1127 family)